MDAINKTTCVKLRPNYAKEWIEQLKGQLENLAIHSAKDVPHRVSESAVPCAGFWNPSSWLTEAVSFYEVSFK